MHESYDSHRFELREVSLSANVAEFVAGLRLADVPPAALRAAKGALLDAVGVAIAGTQSEVGAIMVQWARDAGAKPVAGVIGAGFKTAPTTAARVNGTIAHALDYDPPVPLLSVLLALAETTHVSGRRALKLTWQDSKCKHASKSTSARSILHTAGIRTRCSGRLGQQLLQPSSSAASLIRFSWHSASPHRTQAGSGKTWAR
jgi:hypothetical protein